MPKFYGQIRGFKFDNKQPTEPTPKIKIEPRPKPKPKLVPCDTPNARAVTLLDRETGEELQFSSLNQASLYVGYVSQHALGACIRRGQTVIKNRYELVKIEGA